MRYKLLLVPILLLIALPAFGASTYLGGLSGLILTPDGVIEPPGGWELSFHDTLNITSGTDLTTYGFTYGLVPNLEVGLSIVNNDGTDVAFNGKYRLFSETYNRPSITIGVFDVGSMANFINNNSSFFIVAQKNVTALTEEAINAPSKPLMLSIGFGSGVFDSVFAGFDWTIERRLSLQAEFTSGDFVGKNNVFNAGLRYALLNNLRVDAAVINLEDFAFGVSYMSKIP